MTSTCMLIYCLVNEPMYTLVGTFNQGCSNTTTILFVCLVITLDTESAPVHTGIVQLPIDIKSHANTALDCFRAFELLCLSQDTTLLQILISPETATHTHD